VRIEARELVVVLQPVYDLLKEALKFQSRTERLLADLHSLLMPLTVRRRHRRRLRRDPWRARARGAC
jgi:hypothetical protein